MPDPVEQVFLQARAPTGSWEGPINAYFQGQRNAQENRKLSMEEAASVLQNESNRLAIQEHGLNIELKRKQMERDAQILAGQNEALDIMLMAGQDESGYLNPEIEARLHSLAIRNPAIFTAPAGQALLHNWQGARVASRAMTDAGMANLKPTRITVDPVTGKESITYGEENTALDELRRAQAYKYNIQGDAILEGGTDKQFAPSNTEKLFSLEKRLRSAGDIEGADAVRAQINAPQTQQRLADERAVVSGIRTADTLREHGVQAEGVKLPTLTPVARPLTTAAVTQQQESLIAAHSALSQASKLEPLINSGTFGPAAFVGSLVIDKGLANIYPELLNKERVEARVVAAGLRAATVKAVRSDSNITETEREDIIDDIPSPKKFLDSPARALVQLKTINAGIIDRAVRAARNLKQPVDSILAPIGDSELIKSLFQTGAITEEEAKDWGRAHLPAQ